MRLVSLDLETYRISRGPGAAPKPVIVSIHEDTCHYIARPADVDWGFLDDPDTFLIGANIAFDTSVLIRHMPRLRKAILRLYAEHRVLDVQQAHTLVCVSRGVPAGKFGLETLARFYCDVALDKDTWRLFYGELDVVPLHLWPAGAIEYALVDTWIARKVFDAICAADEYGALGLLGHLTYAAWGLHEAEVDGVRTHPTRARRLAARAEQRILDVTAQLQAAGLVREDGTKDTKAAMSRMLDVFPDAPRTAGGAPSLSEEATEASGDTLLQAYTEYTQAGKMRTAARNLIKGIDLPLQTRFNACMETYRTSSSMPKEEAALVGVQMQNPWRSGGYREVFTPDPGELFIGADYTMAEVFSLAQVCKNLFGFSKLGDALLSGKDVHLLTACMIVGCTYEEILVHPERKHFRQIAKALVFGIPGGLGAAKMVLYARGYGVEITVEQAKRYIWQFKNGYPEVGMYLDWVSAKGYPWTLTHCITGFIRGGVGYTDGANTGFQSLTAYYAKTATARVAAARWDEASPLFGFKLWNMVHDELLCRGPAERAVRAAAELERIMCGAANEVLTDYPISAGGWVSDVWSKLNEDMCEGGKIGNYAEFVEQLRAKGDKKANATLLSLGEPVLLAA